MDAKKLVQQIKKAKETDKVMLNVRVDRGLRDALSVFSKENGVSITEFVEAVLRDLLEGQKPKKQGLP